MPVYVHRGRPADLSPILNIKTALQLGSRPSQSWSRSGPVHPGIWQKAHLSVALEAGLQTSDPAVGPEAAL